MSSRSQQDIDRLAASYGEDFEPDVEAALQRLHRRLDRPTRKAPAAVRPLRTRRWLSVAAAILVLALAGWFLLPDGSTTVTNSGSAPMAVALPDGSRITLQKNADISYDAEFDGLERRVELTGQGFFEVAPDATRPFLVSNGDAMLRVVGTAFNLRSSNGELEVEVSEGSVELTQRERTVAVGPNECAIAKPGARPRKVAAPHLNRHAWRTGKLHFENTPYGEVFATLEANWGVEVTADPGCLDKPLSQTFTETDVRNIINIIAKAGNQTVVETSPGHYRLSGACE